MNFENLGKFKFEGVGAFDIPAMAPVREFPKGEFVHVIQRKKYQDVSKKVLHFFADDVRLTSYWNDPDRHIPILHRFEAVCSPDFSMYTDMPKALQIYNHYRRHWLAAYWQLNGITVYPTISWSDESSYERCFDGDPRNGIVVVASIGTQKSKECKRLFLRGYEEMMKRLEPSGVIFYGKVPEELEAENVMQIPAFYNEIVKRREAAHKNGKTE